MAALKLSLAVSTPEIEQVLPVALLQGSFDEKMQKAARYGANGVELMTVNPRALAVKDLIRSLKRWRLEAAAVASGGIALVTGVTLLHTDPDKSALAQRYLADLIDLAARLDARIVTIGSFRGRASQVNGDGLEKLAEILYPHAEAASKKGVCLALEPLNRYESDLINNHQEGLDFIQYINHPALGLLLDTYHVNIEEKSWTEPFLKVLAAGRLFHVHLGDNNRLPPGDGLIDFAAVVKVLQENHYLGYLSAELLPRPDADTAAQRTINYMRGILK